MKRTELVAALRDLQGRVYGMRASAMIEADRMADEDRRAGFTSTTLYPAIAGAMTGLSRWVAADIDALIEKIEQPTVSPRAYRSSRKAVTMKR